MSIHIFWVVTSYPLRSTVEIVTRIFRGTDLVGEVIHVWDRKYDYVQDYTQFTNGNVLFSKDRR